MGNLDIGLAMVAARIASTEMEKEQEIRNLRESREPDRKREDGPDTAKPPLSRAKLEGIKGELVLIPSVGTARKHHGERAPRKQGEGTTRHIEPVRSARQSGKE